MRQVAHTLHAACQRLVHGAIDRHPGYPLKTGDPCKRVPIEKSQQQVASCSFDKIMRGKIIVFKS